MSEYNISIIVPIYNGSEYVRSCYDLLAQQSLDGIEIIFVDDGSSDDTLKKCIEIEKFNSNFHVYHQENKGVSAARNLGVSMATGEYIGFVDVDDIYEKDMYESLFSCAKKNNLDIVSMEKIGMQGDLSIIDDQKQFLKLFLEKKIRIAVWNKIYKRSLFRNDTFPNNVQIYEDFRAVYNVILKASRIGLLNVDKYHYIKREGSNSRAGQFEEKYLDAINMVNQVCEKTIELYPDLEESCELRKANTYLRISKIYYLRKHPKEYKDSIVEMKKWLRKLSIGKAINYFETFDFIRWCLYLYAFPLFILLIKSIDKE